MARYILILAMVWQSVAAATMAGSPDLASKMSAASKASAGAALEATKKAEELEKAKRELEEGGLKSDEEAALYEFLDNQAKHQKRQAAGSWASAVANAKNAKALTDYKVGDTGNLAGRLGGQLGDGAAAKAPGAQAPTGAFGQPGAGAGQPGAAGGAGRPGGAGGSGSSPAAGHPEIADLRAMAAAKGNGEGRVSQGELAKAFQRLGTDHMDETAYHLKASRDYYRNGTKGLGDYHAGEAAKHDSMGTGYLDIAKGMNGGTHPDPAPRPETTLPVEFLDPRHSTFRGPNEEYYVRRNDLSNADYNVFEASNGARAYEWLDAKGRPTGEYTRQVGLQTEPMRAPHSVQRPVDNKVSELARFNPVVLTSDEWALRSGGQFQIGSQTVRPVWQHGVGWTANLNGRDVRLHIDHGNLRISVP